MKTLLILRHAKSSWSNDQLSDYERPLNKRGLVDAPKVGELLMAEGLVPELILASSAERTTKTAELLMLNANFEGEVHFSRQLYLAEPQKYIELLHEMGGQAKCVLVLGHNPGMEQLVYYLTQGEPEPMPTAALAHVELPIDVWEELALKRNGRLQNIWRPKEM